MLAALMTALFLAVAWMAIVAVAGTLETSLNKVGSALAGRRDERLSLAPVRLSARYPAARTVRARARPEPLRAAA